jgi:hypothetical protein
VLLATVDGLDGRQVVQLRKLSSKRKSTLQNERVKDYFMKNKISAAAPVATLY